MQHSPFISNSCEIIHSKCSSRLSVSRVCEKVKRILSLMLLFFLTGSKKKEGIFGHYFSLLLGVDTPSTLCQKSHVSLGAHPLGL